MFMNSHLRLSTIIERVNKKLLMQFVKQLTIDYQKALDLTADFSPPLNRLPTAYLRDWLTNQSLYNIAMNHEDVKVRMVPNSTGGHFHTEVETANSLITVSQVKHYKEFVREARYRQNLNKKYCPELFQTRIPEERDKVYLIIIHGVLSKENQIPGFARLVIPNHDNKQYDVNRCMYELTGQNSPYSLKDNIIEEIQEKNTPILKI